MGAKSTRIYCAMTGATWWRVVWIATLLLSLSAVQPLQAQDNSDPTVARTGSIVIGSKDDPESGLIGKLLVLLLGEAGYTVVDQTNAGGTTVLRRALESGAIDLYVESALTALSLYHELPFDAFPGERDRAYQLAKRLDEDQGMVWLTPYPYSSNLAMIATPALVDQGIATLEDLAAALARGGIVRLCAWDEFYGRPQGGLEQLQALYDITFQEDDILITDYEETFANLRRGECEVGVGLVTDSRIAAWQLTVLPDPRGAFAMDIAALVVWQAVIEADPALVDSINQLAPYLTQEALSELKIRIELGPDGEAASGDEATVEAVATDFLRSIGLMKLPTLVVGSKPYTSSILVGKLMVLLLQDAGYNVIDQTGYGGAVAARTALEQGKLDLYVESSGTALALFHELPSSAQPDEARRSYQLAKTLDRDSAIAWLEPGAYEDKLTVVVSKELAEQGVRSLAELAEIVADEERNLTFCTWDEFYGRRQTGLPALFAAYALTIAEEKIVIADLDDIFQGVRSGDCTIAVVTGADARIAAWQLQVLDDPLTFFPLEIPAPILRQATVDSNPPIGALLNQLMPLLTPERVQQLTALVDLGADGEISSGDEQSAEGVAQDFLRSQRLIKLPPLTLGSVSDPEQLLLGQMLLLLLQEAGYEVTDQTNLGDAATVRQALENGEIDFYLASSADTLVRSHNLPSAALPTDPKRTHALVKSLDARDGFVWLPAYTSTKVYSLLVGDALWNDGVQSIPDLATLAADREEPLTLCVADNPSLHDIDGLALLASGYNLTFADTQLLTLEQEKIYDALRVGDCDVAEGSRRDGRVPAWNFHELADPAAVFPTTTLALVVRQSVSENNGAVLPIFDTLLPLLTDATVETLSQRLLVGPDGELYSGDEESAQTIAETFLRDAGLLTATAP